MPAGRTSGTDLNLGIDDLWWGDDGRLRSIVSTQPCGPGEVDRPVSSARWVVNGERWTPDGGDQASADRTLDQGDRVVLRTGRDLDSAARLLVLVRDGAETTVDDEVPTQSVSVSGST